MALGLSINYKTPFLAEVKIQSNQEININDKGFCIDIKDFTKLVHDVSDPNDSRNEVHITAQNINDFSNIINGNGVSISVEAKSLTMNILAKGYDTENNSIGFYTPIIMVSFDFNHMNNIQESDSNYHFIKFSVPLLPKVHTGEIHKNNEAAEDPILKTLDNRADYDFYEDEETTKNKIFLNTSASENNIPLYQITYSAYNPKELYDNSYDFYFDSLSSNLNDGVSGVNLNFIQSPTELKTIEIYRNENYNPPKVFNNECYVTEITQDISSNSGTYLKNNATLSVKYMEF